MKTLLTLALLLVVAGDARSYPQVVMIGESTTWGLLDAIGTQAKVTPAEALEALLRKLPAGHPWKNANVRNWGVPGSYTSEWVAHKPHADVCTVYSSKIDFVAAACAQNRPLLHAALETVGPVAGVLVMAGINDWLSGPWEGKPISPVQTVNNLEMLRSIVLSDSPQAVVRIAPPLQVPCFIPPCYATSERNQRRMEIINRGLLSGPDWPLLPLSDGIVHLTDGGNGAVGGLWLDFVP